MPRKKGQVKRGYEQAFGAKIRRIISATEELKVKVRSVIPDVETTVDGVVRGILNSNTGNDGWWSEGIEQGVEGTQRIGNRICLKKIEIIYSIQPRVSSLQMDGTMMRFALVHDSKPNGTIPNISDIFDVGIGATWLQNEVNIQRFRVLKEVTHYMGSTGNNGVTCVAAGPGRDFKWTIRPNKIVSWDSASVGIANLITDNWYVVSIADSNGPVAFTNSMIKVAFTDA